MYHHLYSVYFCTQPIELLRTLLHTGFTFTCAQSIILKQMAHHNSHHTKHASFQILLASAGVCGHARRNNELNWRGLLAEEICPQRETATSARQLYVERPAAFITTNGWPARFPLKKSMVAYIGELLYHISGGTSSWVIVEGPLGSPR